MERLLDETALFLHRVEANLPERKQRVLRRLAKSDPQLAERNVLVVDDDLRNIFALTSLLEGHKMHVQYAENGKRALAKLEENPNIDVVLMDIMMPEMDGYEALRKIRERGAVEGPPRDRAHREGDEGRPREVPRGRCVGLHHQAGRRRPAARRCCASGSTRPERVGTILVRFERRLRGARDDGRHARRREDLEPTHRAPPPPGDPPAAPPFGAVAPNPPAPPTPADATPAPPRARARIESSPFAPLQPLPLQPPPPPPPPANNSPDTVTVAPCSTAYPPAPPPAPPRSEMPTVMRPSPPAWPPPPPASMVTGRYGRSRCTTPASARHRHHRLAAGNGRRSREHYQPSLHRRTSGRSADS